MTPSPSLPRRTKSAIFRAPALRLELLQAIAEGIQDRRARREAEVLVATLVQPATTREQVVERLNSMSGGPRTPMSSLATTLSKMITQTVPVAAN